MNTTVVVIDSAICLGGLLLIVFNRQIGEFANKIDPFPNFLSNLYFPRVNAVILGLFFFVLGCLGIVDQMRSQ